MPTPKSVLVTRPQGQELALCRGLREAGYEPHHQPLLELEPLAELDTVQRGLLLDLDRFEHIIFISGNAVRHGMARIEDYWPQWPVGIHCYGVGAATAGKLADYGIPALSPDGEMTSESLLALPSLREVAGQRVLIVKGEGGRDTLRQKLSRRGAEVAELVCYRRRCPQLPAGELAARIRRWSIELILLSSGEGLTNLLRLLSPEETLNVSALGLLVPSRRVAEQAEAAGFSHLITAENASDAAVLRALTEQVPVMERMRER